ncbi:MAG: bile acid:sodium symporter family protein [Pseudomonadota bacterium]
MPIILDVFLPLSLAFIMLSLGLGLTLADFRRLLEMPRAVGVGLIAQILLLPVAAFAMGRLFGLPQELALGLMILSLCPGGVTSNILTKLALGNVALSVTLTGVVSLLSIFTVPALTAFFAGLIMGVEAPPVNVTKLSIALVLMTLVPVSMGVAIRHFAPGFASRIEGPVGKLANLLFVVIVVLAIIGGREDLVENLTTLGPALVALIAFLLITGLALARMTRLDMPTSTAIALETGVQNATLGIAVGSLITPGGAGLAALALPSAVYGVLMYLVVAPFILWRRRM